MSEQDTPPELQAALLPPEVKMPPSAEDLARATGGPLRYPFVPGQQPPYLVEIPGAWPFSTVIRVVAQRTRRDGTLEITDALVQYVNVYPGPKPEDWPGA